MMPRSFLVKKKHRNGNGKVLPEVASEPPRIFAVEPAPSSTPLDPIRVKDFGGNGTPRGKSSDSEAEHIVVSSTSDDRRSRQQLSPHRVEDRVSRGRESGSVKSSTSEEYETEEEEEEEEEEKRNKAMINEYQYNHDAYERRMRSESLAKSFHFSFGTESDLTLQTAEASRNSSLHVRSTTSNFPLASMPDREAVSMQNCLSDLWHKREQFDTRSCCLIPKWSGLSHGVLPYPVALRRMGDDDGAVVVAGSYPGPAWWETGVTAASMPGCESRRRQPFLSPVHSDSNTPPLVPSEDTPISPTSPLVPPYSSITPNLVSSCSSPSPPIASTPSHLYPQRYHVPVRLQGSSPKLGFSVPEILWGGRDEQGAFENRKLLVPDSTSVLTRPETNPFECATCRKTYSTSNGLAKHQRAHCASKQTTAVRRYDCPRCDRVYTTVGALKMHIRTHTLPCHCPVCGKAFSRPWLLQGHMRTHTGERPFECPHCSRAFADRSNLRAHLQTHSDVKRYSCRRCGKMFSRMSLLIKHSDNNCSA